VTHQPAVATIAPPPVRRIAVLSVHTSPLDQPGEGDGGGLNVYVRAVASRLAARGVTVDIFTRRSREDQPATAWIAPGVAVHHLDAGPVAPVAKDEVANHLCAFLLALQQHPTAGSHDLVHAHYWLSGWVGRRVAPRWGVPLVQTFHTLAALKNATLAPGDTPESPLRLLAEQRVARDADRVLVLTCGEARWLHRTTGLSGARLTVVPAGVDLERFSPGVPAEPDAPELLFVGRLQPLKGPDVAIRTLAAVREHVPAARLRIVGGVSGSGAGRTGPTELARLATRLGVAAAVTFEGAVDQAELVARYRSARVLLAPSRSETFGLVALEAQACGLPVVAADVPGLQAVVRGGGTLVAGHDPRDHAAAAVRYLTEPVHATAARRAGIAAARAASWDRTVDRLLAVYGDVVAERAAAQHPSAAAPIERTA
jgi:D-inositol-3-phosphate glycosyltransferase